MSKELRKINEVILRDGRTLEMVLELHKKWLNGDENGEKAYLSVEDLSRVDLRNINLSYAIMNYTNLNGSNLNHTDFSYAKMNSVDFSYAKMNGADFSYAEMNSADFNNANAKDSNFSYVDFSYANVKGSDFSYANFNNGNFNNTKFYLTNLHEVKGAFVSVGNISSKNDTIYYFYKDNRILCRCFDGTMEEFKKMIKESYREDNIEYQQYIIAIDTLNKLSKLQIKLAELKK